MYGSLIGLVPKHFIIVLIENHWWYEYSRTSSGLVIEDAYNTAVERKGSLSFGNQ